MARTAMIWDKRLSKSGPDDQCGNYAANLFEAIKRIYHAPIEQPAIHALRWIVPNRDAANKRIKQIRQGSLCPRIIAALSHPPDNVIALAPTFQEQTN